jgi:hypothetical protein
MILENVNVSRRFDFSQLDGLGAISDCSVSPSGKRERGRHSQEASDPVQR